jgi:hypothetical protein
MRIMTSEQIARLQRQPPPSQQCRRRRMRLTRYRTLIFLALGLIALVLSLFASGATQTPTTTRPDAPVKTIRTVAASLAT